MKEKLSELKPYIIIILIVVTIRTFFFTPIRVNGESMEKTLFDKEIMILDKISPRFNAYKRFDIVVLKVENSYLIKRIVGLPGEKIAYINNQLFINGYEVKDPFTNEAITDFKEVTIAENNYYVLGDNRGSSKDSRFIGTVKAKDIIGRTNIVVFPFKKIGKVK